VDVVGGHTAEGQEAMAGLSVLGVAGPTLLTKSGSRVGDVIALSKPIGAGMIVRGYQQGVLEAHDIEEAMLTMERSNRAASQEAVELGAVAVTDVTGFGVLGHLAEMLADAGLGATLELERVPVLSAVERLSASFARSRFLDENLHYCLSRTKLSGIRDRVALAPLLDPQTSGGLLAVIPPEQAEMLDGTGFRAIGRVVGDDRIEVVR
jgi:selenide,water dikinase